MPYFRIIKQILTTTLGVSILLLVFFYTGLRLVLPALPQAREDAELITTNLIGVPVEIAELGGTWGGFGPRLTLKELQLKSRASGENILSFNEVQLGFSFLDLFLEQRFTVNELVLDGVNLVVHQGLDGKFGIRGFSSNRQAETTDDTQVVRNLLSLLPSNAKIRFENTSFTWQRETENGFETATSRINFGVLVKPNQYHIEVQGAMPASLGRSMEAIIDVYGNPADIENLYGDMYLKVLGVDVSSDWVEQFLAGRLEMTSGLAGLEVRLSWDAGTLVKTHGRVDLSDIVLDPRSDSPAIEALGEDYFSFQRVAALFDWQRSKDNAHHIGLADASWDFYLKQFEITRGDKTRYHGNFRTSFRPENGMKIIHGSLGEIRIEDVAPFLQASGTIPETAAAWLATSPHGSILNTQYQFKLLDTQLLDFTATGDVVDFSTLNVEGFGLPASGVPGVSGVNGKFTVGMDHGELALNSYYPQIKWQQLYKQPLQPQQLITRLRWNTGTVDGKQGYSLRADELALIDGDMSLQGNLVVTGSSDGAPQLKTAIKLNQTPVKSLTQYVPDSLPPAAKQWLEVALASGSLDGSLEIEGPASGIPYANGEGKFSLQTTVQEPRFVYMEGWPAIENFAATISFDGREVIAEGTSGRAAGNEIRQLKLNLSQLDNPRLQAAVSIDASPAGMLNFAQQSPLADTLGEALNGIEGYGSNRLDISLDVPVNDPQSGKVQGSLQFNDAKFVRSDLEVIENLSGKLHFGLDRVYSEQLRADAQGLPIDFDIDLKLPALAQAQSSPQFAGKLAINTHVDFSDKAVQYRPILEQYLPPSLLAALSGKMPINIDAGPVNGRSPGETIRVQSDLKSLGIDLPAPFAKPSGQSLPTNIAVSFREPEVLNFSLYQYDTLAAKVKLDKGQQGGFELRGGKLVYGSDQLGDVDFDGLEVVWTAAEMSVDKLAEYFAKDFNTEHVDVPVEEGFKDAETVVQPLLPTFLRRAQLSVEKLTAGQRDWHAVDLTLQRDTDFTSLTMQSVEVGGVLSMPNAFLEQTGQGWADYVRGEADDDLSRLMADKVIEVELSHVKLENVFPDPVEGDPVDKPEEKKPTKTDALAAYHPAKFPRVQLAIRDMQLDELRLGAIKLHLRPTVSGLAVEHFSNTDGDFTLSLSGAWERYIDEHYSEFRISLNTDKIEHILSTAKVGQVIEAEQLEGRVALNWEGSPAAFNIDQTNGRAWMDIQAGYVHEVNPVAAKVLALLSVYKLPKRLMMDFSDVFSSGLAFDQVSGHFTFANGQAFTTDTRIDIPGVEVEVLGRIGVTDKDYDQHLTVTPELTSGVAIAGAMASGIGVGAALFFGQELLGNPLENFGRMRFQLEGDFSEPAPVEEPAKMPAQYGPRRR